jgi:hypothetical protein
MKDSTMSNSNLTIPQATSGVIDNNSAPVTTHLPGGVTSIQFGKADEGIDARFAGSETTRGGVEDGGGFRTLPTGEVEQFGAVTRVQTTPPTPTDNPLDNATSPWGSPASAINRDTVLDFGAGQQVPVAVAVNLGWLRLDGDRYVVTGRHKADIGALSGQR